MKDSSLGTTPQNDMHHLQAILKDMTSIMMTTSPYGTLAGSRTRPMSIAKRGEDGTLYFLTSADTSQVQDLRIDDIGMCTGQSKTEFVTLLGTFNIAYDSASIEEVWSPAAEAWFPRGKADPNLRVIVFRPRTAELWDVSGVRGIAYLIDVAKSWITKEPPKGSAEVHAKIEIRPA